MFALDASDHAGNFDLHRIDCELLAEAINESQTAHLASLVQGPISSVRQFCDGDDRKTYWGLAVNGFKLFEEFEVAQASSLGSNYNARI